MVIFSGISVVITLHSPFNQRDVSHFEKFREFHEKLYYYVEPISITPFSPKSVERFLPLYIAAIVRQSYDRLGGRKEARNINDQLANRIKANVKSYFKKRYDRTRKLRHQEAALLTQEMLDVIFAQVDKYMDIWLNAANKTGVHLVYNIPISGTSDSLEQELFVSPEDYEGDITLDKWIVPNALRVIEPESVIHVIR